MIDGQPERAIVNPITGVDSKMNEFCTAFARQQCQSHWYEYRWGHWWFDLRMGRLGRVRIASRQGSRPKWSYWNRLKVNNMTNRIICYLGSNLTNIDWRRA